MHTLARSRSGGARTLPCRPLCPGTPRAHALASNCILQYKGIKDNCKAWRHPEAFHNVVAFTPC
eukprot:3583063-Pleurochrysis_carterae.AAC.1